MPSEGFSDTDVQVERWLFRHGISDAFAKWRVADAANAPGLAFIAIVGEPRLLMRLSKADAFPLVRQAERVAAEIAGAKANESAIAAAQVVTSRIATWRNSARNRAGYNGAESVAGKGSAAAVREDELRSVYQAALDLYPQFNETIARSLAATTLGLGAVRLARLGEPADSVLALYTTRFAVRSSRAQLRGPCWTREQILMSIGIVQTWTGLSGTNALIVPYCGRGGSTYERALALFVDASTAVELAHTLPDGAASPGFDMWEHAEEWHAYAVVCLNPGRLQHMSMEAARACAAAAGRLAGAHLADPARALPEMPGAGEKLSPQMVLATSRGILRGDIPPRRSAAARHSMERH